MRKMGVVKASIRCVDRCLLMLNSPGGDGGGFHVAKGRQGVLLRPAYGGQASNDTTRHLSGRPVLRSQAKLDPSSVGHAKEDLYEKIAHFRRDFSDGLFLRIFFHLCDFASLRLCVEMSFLSVKSVKSVKSVVQLLWVAALPLWDSCVAVRPHELAGGTPALLCQPPWTGGTRMQNELEKNLDGVMKVPEIAASRAV